MSSSSSRPPLDARPLLAAKEVRDTEELAAKLRRRKIVGPEACATATVELLIRVIKDSKWKDVRGEKKKKKKKILRK